MSIALEKALDLIFAGDRTLLQILAVTLRMSFASSLAALLFGVPLGILLGSARFPGKKILIVLNRTMMGMPPVVCGLLCFLMFCGVGPLRRLKLLYTVTGMVIAQILLITPIVAGTMEPFAAAIYPDLRETALGLGLKKEAAVADGPREHLSDRFDLSFGFESSDGRGWGGVDGWRRDCV